MSKLFQTGNSEPSSKAIVSLELPDVGWFKAAFVKALSLMCTESNWETQGDATVSFARDKSNEMLETVEFDVILYSEPIGAIEMWLGDTPPEKWLVLNGQLVGRATYPELHAIYGDTYDPGDGETTFGLPDMRDRLPIGASASIPLGTINGSKSKSISTSNLPAHNHPVTDPGHTHPPAAGTTVFVGRTAGGSTDWVRATAGATFRQDVATGGNTTGITVGDTGSGTPLDVLNPVRGLNFIVYAGH